MNKMIHRLVVGLLMGGAPLVLAGDDEAQLSDNKGPSKMQEKVTKSRAEKYKDSDGVSKDGRKYIYVDKKEIDSEIKDARGKNGIRRAGQEKEVNIGSTTIRKDEKVRRVDVVVETDKKIDVKTDGKPTTVNVGKVTVEEGAAKHRKLETNIIVDAEKGIKVH